MTDTAISVQGLGKEYIIGHKKSGDLRTSFNDRIQRLIGSDTTHESFWALKDIDFEIKHGEAVGIIGRNGAGKSTLLKILSRITDPTTGRFEINGRVSSLLEVGTGFHMELTGRENIFLNGTILGMKRAEIKQKFDEIVDFSGVEKFLDTPVKHYSSGMKVRLAFSVAAHLEPEILIVDEVLAVGDAEFQKKCLGKMGEVSKNEGRTVLFVSHNMGAVQSLCSRGILLQSGNLLYENDIDSVVKKYSELSNPDNSETINYRNLNKSTYDFEIKSFDILDKNGYPEKNFVSGNQIDFRISYFSGQKINDLAIGIIIKDNVSQFVSVLNNKIAGQEIKINNNTGEIFCSIKKNPFMYGKFSVTLIIQLKGQLIYNIEDINSFYISEGDYFGSGFPNALNRQGIYIENDWVVND